MTTFNKVMLALDVGKQAIHDVIVLREVQLGILGDERSVLLCMSKGGDIITCAKLDRYDYIDCVDAISEVEELTFTVEGSDKPINWEEYKTRIKSNTDIHRNLATYKFSNQPDYESFISIWHKYGSRSSIKGALLN